MRILSLIFSWVLWLLNVPLFLLAVIVETIMFVYFLVSKKLFIKPSAQERHGSESSKSGIKYLWEDFRKWRIRKQLAEGESFGCWLRKLGDVPEKFAQKFGLKYIKNPHHGWTLTCDLGFRHPKGGLAWIAISKTKGSADSAQIDLTWQVWDFDSLKGYRRVEKGKIFSINDVDLAMKLEEGLRKVLLWEKIEVKGEWTPMYLKHTKEPTEKIRKRSEEDEAGYPLPKV